MLQDIAGSAKAPEATPSTTEPATPQTTTSTSPISSDSTATKGSQTETATPEKVTTPNEPVASSEITDWDSSPVTPATSEASAAFDFSSIGKTFNVEAKSQDELISHFKTLKEENEAFKKASPSQAEIFANDVLKQANEIAKANGDYLGFLGVATINYDAVDDRTLLESQVRGYFPEGAEGDEQTKNYLDNMDGVELRVKASQARDMLKAGQMQEKQSRVSQIEAQKLQREQQKQSMDKQLSETLGSIKDVDGFVLNPSHKKQLFADLSTGDIYKKHFYTDGKYDFNKAVRAAFILNEYDKVSSYLKSKAKLEGTRQVINTLTNAELNKTTTTVSSSPAKSPMDDWFERLQGKK